MKSLCQTEWQARDALLNVVKDLDYSTRERLGALGLAPDDVAKVRTLTERCDDRITPAALDDVSPWYRIGVMRSNVRGSSSGTPIGEMNGWTILAWTT